MVTIQAALVAAKEKDDWSFAQIAVAGGCSEAAVRPWFTGKSLPRADVYQRLRAAWPTFADMVDGKIAA